MHLIVTNSLVVDKIPKWSSIYLWQKLDAKPPNRTQNPQVSLLILQHTAGRILERNLQALMYCSSFLPHDSKFALVVL